MNPERFLDALKKAAGIAFTIAFSQVGGFFLFIIMVFVGIKALEFANTSDFSRESLSAAPFKSLFQVIVEDSRTKLAFPVALVSLEYEHARRKLPKAFTYRLSRKSEEIRRGVREWKYSVEESSSGEEQTVTVLYKDDDSSSKSIYRVKNEEVFPVTLKPMYFGFMFQSVFYVFVLFVIVNISFRLVCFVHFRFFREKQKKPPRTKFEPPSSE
ncbi:MAG: hypothetical protein LBM17_02415 [Candidatus Accumulibacter sp.]|jgi:hypothetical protein|nr:hypothetical protein [Accumulibacter sp.]